MPLPERLSINAWTGPLAPVSAVADDTTLAWARAKPYAQDESLAPPEDAKLTHWRTDERVGWGLVLPWREGFTRTQLGTAEDAPEPIQRLVQARGNAPVFRYRRDSLDRNVFLWNYRSGKQIAISAGQRGLKPDTLPSFLLIYATPEEIPWEFQFILNPSFCVGRLDLTGPELENYVQALLGDFKASAANVRQSVIWAVRHETGDITDLMRATIAAKLHEQLIGDDDLRAGVRFIDGQTEKASVSELTNALAEKQPGLIVTTSHGQAHPLDNLEALRRGLGLLIDQEEQPLDPAALLDRWQPDGAIWYAHACFSAGSDNKSSFLGITGPDSHIDELLNKVATSGAYVAPLPRALLGAKRPLRAFIGHVEPTFDWTLRRKDTGQHLTDGIIASLYNGLFQKEPEPVGAAFRDYFEPMKALHGQHDKALESGDEELTLSTRLMSRDIQATVILGDPTAALPPLNA